MIILRFVSFLIWISLVPCLWAGDSWSESMETWMDEDGRTLQAQLLRVSGTQVQLSLPDGAARSIPLEKFAAPDQRRILERMVDHPALLEYTFALTSTRQADGMWQVRVVNSGGNTLDDLQWTGRFTGGTSPQLIGTAQPVRRLEPGQHQIISLRQTAEAGVGATGMQLRLYRKNAVVWEWATPGQPAPDWPLEPGQVRVPAKGKLAAQVLAALARVGSGSGQLGLPSPKQTEQEKPAAAEAGEDLVKLFESP